MDFLQRYHTYRLFFKVRILHDYYLNRGPAKFEEIDKEEQSRIEQAYDISKDLLIEPTDSCRKKLQNGGMVFRQVRDGFEVYIRTSPTFNHSYHRPHATIPLESFTLSFRLAAINPYFSDITDLPLPDPPQQLRYFSNLKYFNGYLQHIENNDLARTEITLAATPYYFNLPEGFPNGNDFALEFYNALDANTVSKVEHYYRPNPSESSFQCDLSDLPAGFYRYNITTPDGKAWDSRAVYLDSQLFRDGAFAVVDISMLPGGNSPLLQDEGALPEQAPVFDIRWANRSTYWRYIFDVAVDVDQVPELKTLDKDWDERSATSRRGRYFITREPLPLTIDNWNTFIDTDTLPPPGDHHVIEEDDGQVRKVISEIKVKHDEIQNAVTPIPTVSPQPEVESLPVFDIEDVASCVPVFIGFTEKAGRSDLAEAAHQVVRITSLSAYAEIFGGPHPPKVQVNVTGTGEPDEITKVDVQTETKFILYYALQLYFANGGGPCYVLSVGHYDSEEDDLVPALQQGLEAVRKIDEVTTLVVPEASILDAWSMTYNMALNLCNELGDRFVLIDVPFVPPAEKDAGTNDSFMGAIHQWRQSIYDGTDILKFGAAYAPYLQTTISPKLDSREIRVTWTDSKSSTTSTFGELEDLITNDAPDWLPQVEQVLQEIQLVLPPSPAVAGLYARSDARWGSWAPPANVTLDEVVGPASAFTEEQEKALLIDLIAGKSVNPLRQLDTGDTVIWGARTLAGNDNRSRYIHVNRFSALLIKSMTKAIVGQVLFKTNDQALWEWVRRSVNAYLIDKWKAGALLGAKETDAFYVKIGLGQSMTTQDILEKRMITDVGFALLQPGLFSKARIISELSD